MSLATSLTAWYGDWKKERKRKAMLALRERFRKEGNDISHLTDEEYEQRIAAILNAPPEALFGDPFLFEKVDNSGVEKRKKE